MYGGVYFVSCKAGPSNGPRWLWAFPSHPFQICMYVWMDVCMHVWMYVCFSRQFSHQIILGEIHLRLGGVNSPLGSPPHNREIVSCRACVRAEPMPGGNASQT